MPDATTPLIGRVAMPQFDWMGALFGGPQYLSSYFAQKGAAQQLQTQQAYNAQDASNLLQTPQFQATEEPGSDPFWKRWAVMQGGNPQMSALGTSLLDQQIQHTYGTQMLNAQNAMEINRQQLREGLEEKLGTFNANTQLETMKKEAQFNVATQQAAISAMNDPANANNPMVLRSLYKTAFGEPPPTDMSVVPLGNGNYTFSPLGGSEMADLTNKIQTGQAVMSGLGAMDTMLTKGIGSKSVWDANRAMLGVQLGQMFGEAGGKALEEQLPGYYDNITQIIHGEGGTGAMQEKVRALTYMIAGRQRQLNQANRLKGGELPDVSGSPLGRIGIDYSNPPANPPSVQQAAPAAAPVAPATAAQRISRGQPLERVPQSQGSIWDRPPGSANRMWRGGK